VKGTSRFLSKCGGLGLALLLASPARAQTGSKLAVPSAPVEGADTTNLVFQRTPNGVRYAFRERGTGALAVPGSRVAVRYTGFLPNGRIFDATQAWGSAFRFRVGRHEAIAGWDELLPLVPAGSRVRVLIPAAMAYGAKGVRHPDDDSAFLIPPDTDLVFELQVMSVR
jgi:FKBP-type peptidyl-prolyl cis-trans isomerase